MRNQRAEGLTAIDKDAYALCSIKHADPKAANAHRLRAMQQNHPLYLNLHSASIGALFHYQTIAF